MSSLPVQCADCSAHFLLSPNDISGPVACSECGGTRLYRFQPSPTNSDGTLRNMVDTDSQKDQGGNPLGEGTIMGNDGERPAYKRDNFMHSKVSDLLSKSVEGKFMDRSRFTFDMDPYPALFSDESFVEHSASVVREGAAAAIPLAEALAPEVVPAVAEGVGGLASGIGNLMKGVFSPGNIGKGIGIQEGENMLGGPGGGSGGAPQSLPGPADLATLSTVTADYDTPSSGPVGLDVSDPTRTDQHEFNDGDNTNRPDNPNLQDSGASGEDQVRQDHGFAPDSPAIERANLLMPLLMHYYNSPESGIEEPLLMGLHKTLADENPNYLHNADTPESEAAVQKILEHHKGLGVHARTKTSIVPPMQQMPGMQMPGGAMQGAPGTGQCKNCGAVTSGAPVCATCGAASEVDPTGAGMMGPLGQQAGGGYATGMGFLGANHQGPVTPQQIAAVQQLLTQQGRIGELPNVVLNPQDYAREMDSIAQNPNAAPQVDPSQVVQPPAPPQGPPGGDPSQGGQVPMGPDPNFPSGGGMPPQQSSVTAADNVARRCPECHSGTTGLADEEGTCYCHACGNVWKEPVIKQSPTSSTRVSEDLVAVNPDTQPASEHGHIDRDQQQDSSMTWQDATGQQLIPGQEYEMHNPAYQIPDIVKVVYVHPNDIGLKIVGEFSNEGGDNEPDIKLTQQRFKMDNLSFTPSQQTQQTSTEFQQPQTPGDSAIPPASQTTTDESTNSYPDHQSSTHEAEYQYIKQHGDKWVILQKGTGKVLSTHDSYEKAVAAFKAMMANKHGSVEDEVDENICPKCGEQRLIEHTHSSSTRDAHTCYNCNHVWETSIEDFGRESSSDLSWLNADESDDFWGGYERAQKMSTSGQSRSLADIAAKDNRLAEISDRLSHNKQEAEQFLRTAGKRHSPSEQRALIDENGMARNSDLLDLEGTHYKMRDNFESGQKPGFGGNVRDEDVFLGI